jgi:hypothetical protein
LRPSLRKRPRAIRRKTGRVCGAHVLPSPPGRPPGHSCEASRRITRPAGQGADPARSRNLAGRRPTAGQPARGALGFSSPSLALPAASGHGSGRSGAGEGAGDRRAAGPSRENKPCLRPRAAAEARLSQGQGADTLSAAGLRRAQITSGQGPGLESPGAFINRRTRQGGRRPQGAAAAGTGRTCHRN